MYYPVSLEQRVSNAGYIVLGQVVEKHTYVDQATGNINTLNKLKVNAWLKNHSAVETLYVITLGGVYGNKATLVNPSLQLDQQHEYVLMLEADNLVNDDKNFRRQNPQALQLLAYADAQGAFANSNNEYYDISDRSKKKEQDFFQSINNLTGQVAKKPSGEIFQSRNTLSVPPNQIEAITTFSPNPTRGGTIDPADFITITGSGFGTSPGTVFFSNANNGGATFISSGVASDIVAWTDASITVKVPQDGGTGPIRVNAADVSGSSLIVNYGHSAINSDFFGFPGDTRQRYYFRNMNTFGGYTYQYNTTSGFSGNAAARASFERALITWRCNTGMNWRIGANTATGFGDDGVNIVLFDPGLPANVLARATTRFSGSAIPGFCEQQNTIWCADELDIQFRDIPGGLTWEYGPATPAINEYDFETVALHELGHHHGLQHVISPGAVMHFAIANGSSNRILSTNDIAGANARIAYSTTPTCFNPTACGAGPMTTIASGSCSTLPVTLVSFTGERVNVSANQLKWSTAQEQNSKVFYIQRSSNGTLFNDIDFVAAAGNSNQVINYTYPDKNAGPYGWFYRLRMVDIDGQEKFSSIIFIEGDKTSQWKIWAGETGNKIYFYNNTGVTEVASFKLFASNGQLVFVRTINSGTTEISTPDFPRGIYHYQLLQNGKSVTGKLWLGSK
ncbi:hypothetical protein CAP36_05220 [Chitinophagaceae bacterium IBVUCB2]|nr:hypothetical protein CAP36_05220 [Chitinophagaceae bacterium IBVUCB2]